MRMGGAEARRPGSVAKPPREALPEMIEGVSLAAQGERVCDGAGRKGLIRSHRDDASGESAPKILIGSKIHSSG